MMKIVVILSFLKNISTKFKIKKNFLKNKIINTYKKNIN
jgi:hypothetical protein